MEREGTDPRPAPNPVSLSETDRTELLAELAKLAYMPEVKGFWYNGKTVVLDGYRFVGCRFDNCTLVVNSVHFELRNCFIDCSNSIEWRGDMAKMAQLFSFFSSDTGNRRPDSIPARNEDGTITIAA